MSGGEHVLRCRQWLVDQIEQLAGLRNANPRDPSFKLWRQNTVTVLERIWPNEAGRVERFRRIAFSPSHGRASSELVRAGFSRGGTEAYGYLRALLDVIDREGVPEPAQATDPGEQENGPREDDFPVLDLPSGNITAPVAPDQGDGNNMIDLGGNTVLASGYEDTHVRADDAPAPPTLHIEAGNAPASSSAPRMPEAPAAREPANVRAESAAAPSAAPSIVRATPGARPRPNRNGRKSKPQGKARLKDMLGLGALEAAAHEVITNPAAERPVPSEAVVPAAVVPPTPTAADTPPPAEPAAASEQGIVTSQPRPLRRKPQRIESLASLLSTERDEAMPAAAEPPASAATQPLSAPAEGVFSPADGAEYPGDEPVLDAEESARATEDFMLNSPVFGVQGRPVHRASDGTSYQDPDAIAVATLASDVGRLGVPEGGRASARAELHGLARQIESGDLDWARLREVVTFAMEFPKLACRLLPIVLPWLERAA